MKSFTRRAITTLGMSLLQGCTLLVDPGSAHTAEARIDFSDPVLNQRRVFIVGVITEATAAEAIRKLLFLDAGDSSPIDLYLMTPGGDLKAAFAVEHAMRLMRSRINTCALGECNSSGVVLLAAGTGERQAFVDSTFVIHGMEVKNRPPAKYIECTQEAYTAFWRQHTRLPESWLPVPPGRVFILTAKEALEYGVIDKILEAPVGVAAQLAPIPSVQGAEWR